MRSRFPLFQSHLDLAHDLWSRLLVPGNTVVDATCGNGHDTLFLAQKVLQIHNPGLVYACDIQPEAIAQTKALLEKHLEPNQLTHIRLEQRSHATFPSLLTTHSPTLFVYNLGYLPGGNKAMTTRTETTLQSLTAACLLLKEGGAISITCYPGHPEGAKEEQLLIEWSRTLSPLEWNCSWTHWMNRREAPSLLILQKKFG